MVISSCAPGCNWRAHVQTAKGPMCIAHARKLCPPEAP